MTSVAGQGRKPLFPMAELKSARTVALSRNAPNGIALYRAGECRCSAAYPQHCVTKEHKYCFIAIDSPILPVVARSAVSILDQTLRDFLIFPAGSTSRSG
jgi:hypothetical protein